MSRSGNLIFPTVLLLLGGVSYGSVISANRLAVEAGFPFIAYAFWQMLAFTIKIHDNNTCFTIGVLMLRC